MENSSAAVRCLGDLRVHPIGLGAMPMSRKGAEGVARAEATVHAALDAGVTLIDTADCYGPQDFGPHEEQLGHNERLVAAALASYGGNLEGVVVATKGGIRRDGPEWPIDGRPEWIHDAVRGSLSRLGVEAIDLYQHHRPDPEVPYAESIGAFKELYDDGLVRRVGLSNASTAQIREAHGILGPALVSVQNQFSPGHRDSLPELRLCAELGLAFLPWSPLDGMSGAAGLGSAHAEFAAVAAGRGVSAQQIALAWELAQDPCVIPIPGASRPESIMASAAAAELVLTPAELARLDGE